MAFPEPYVVPPKSGTHSSTMIFLHGLGSNSQDFGTVLLSELSSAGATLAEHFPEMKFIFPNAKRSRSTVLKRSVVSQWFNKASFEDVYHRGYLQIDGLIESTAFIRKLVLDEIELVGPDRVVLGGISQGCATALQTLLTLELPLNSAPKDDKTGRRRIAAFVGMSGYLPFAKDIVQELEDDADRGGDGSDFFGSNYDKVGISDIGLPELSSQDKRVLNALNFIRTNLDLPRLSTLASSALDTPVIISHGDADERVALKFGHDMAKTLEGLGMKTELTVHKEMGHWFKVPDQIDAMVELFEKALSS